ncbi:LOW QUALITY PROTEIN: cell division cycle 7-related protein kinase-like [Trichogramma pretiosum]|uniref:LOW QUALITY PROTEIN: cell division cycle 7-related protein kinase-like n=1 Tax=Trichogramma pretiosum TaxID=7493 RepID=UPI000C71C428|nr:LOW QUALITY PROTEIN: cell division cycle 7-related protein kinase-like [Trichogramma pretiosum]
MSLEISKNNSKENDIDENRKDKNVRYLLESVPQLETIFKVIGKIGEGTFSSVFLAYLKSNPNKYYAIKQLVPTVSPNRILRELKCLKDIGGTDYVAGVELCIREAGNVVFVMEYLYHDKFADYALNMPIQELRDYMRALLTALRRVHQFKIIHRDVKPSNFLYNRQKKRYMLVDFGLAQSLDSIKSNPSISRNKCPDENKVNSLIKDTKKSTDNRCICLGKPKVCSICIMRPEQNVNRAGTPGFRAPEVLLKHHPPTMAIDMWASGVMMLFILSSSHCFFRPPNDIAALAEIVAIFGTEAVQKCAKALGKKFICGADTQALDLRDTCQKSRKRKKNPNSNSSSSVLQEDYPDAAYDLLEKLLDLNHSTRITAEEALNHSFLKS